MKTESDLFRALRRGNPHWTMWRVENTLDRGFPDVVACEGVGNLIFLELKIGPPILRNSQYAWLKKYGRFCFAYYLCCWNSHTQETDWYLLNQDTEVVRAGKRGWRVLGTPIK